MNEIVSENSMKKYYIYILFLFVFTESVYSQFDAQLSQYMLHHSSFNPAAVGESERIDVILQPRINLINFDGSGTTTVFSIHSPLKLGDSKHGVGVSFLNDEIGWLSNKTFHLQYAFKKNIGKAKLSIGVDLGFVNIGFSGDSVAQQKITLGEYHNQIVSDPAIPLTQVSGTSLDMSVGAWFSLKEWYSGFSLVHLNRPTVTWTPTAEFNVFSTMFFTGGFNYKLLNPKYVLKPSVLLKSDFSSWQLDLSSRVEYDNKFWGGLTYRVKDAVVLMAGLNVAGGLSVGYAFDVSTSKLITTNYGSHELVVIYSFEYALAKGSKKYKSVRFL